MHLSIKITLLTPLDAFDRIIAVTESALNVARARTVIEIVGRSRFHSREGVFVHLISRRSNEREVLLAKRAAIVSFKQLTSEVAH